MIKGILNLQNLNEGNQYEMDLKKYNKQEVTIIDEYENSYEIETSDGSEYTIFKNELKII